MEDTNKELERLQRQLLEEEPDPLDDEQLYELLREDVEPAFDNPGTIHEPNEPLIYRNYSNGYGTAELPEEPEPKTSKDDKVIIGLMITASALCVGILGVLVYWMEAFIR